MQHVTIHDSGKGADRLEVVSYGNGLSYAFLFGEVGTTMSSIYLTGDDAARIREAYDAAEDANPDRLCREIWLELIEPYRGFTW